MRVLLPGADRGRAVPADTPTRSAIRPGCASSSSSSPRFRAAASQMHRLSLVKVDGARDLIQMHRVVQAVTRGQLRQNRPETFLAYRAAVDTLLAESNPGNPDRAATTRSTTCRCSTWSPIATSSTRPIRPCARLIIDQVRRLHLRGGHVEAMRFGQDALRVWRERLGPDDLQVLTMAVEVAIAMRLGRPRRRRPRAHPGARSACSGAHYGEDHEVTLLCANAYGADLRTRGQFSEALDLDLSLLPKFERVFRPRSRADAQRPEQHRRRLPAARPLPGRPGDRPADLRDRRRILGPDDPRTLYLAGRGGPRPARPRSLPGIAGHRAQGGRGLRGAAGAGRTPTGSTRARDSPPRCARPAITGTRCRRARTSSSATGTTSARTTPTRSGPPPT